jgi:hypothetical protein
MYIPKFPTARSRRAAARRAVVTAFVFAITSSCGSDSSPDPPPPPPPTEELPPTFSLAYTSDPGDPIGEGESQSFTVTDGKGWGAWAVGNDVRLNEIFILYRPPGEISPYRLDIQAPVGQALTVGTYENAVRYPESSATRPALSFGAHARSCGFVSGRFVIHEGPVLGKTNFVERLRVTFEQRCEFGTTGALRGEVVIGPPRRN